MCKNDTKCLYELLGTCHPHPIFKAKMDICFNVCTKCRIKHLRQVPVWKKFKYRLFTTYYRCNCEVRTEKEMFVMSI